MGAGIGVICSDWFQGLKQWTTQSPPPHPWEGQVGHLVITHCDAVGIDILHPRVLKLVSLKFDIMWLVSVASVALAKDDVSITGQCLVFMELNLPCLSYVTRHHNKLFR